MTDDEPAPPKMTEERAAELREAYEQQRREYVRLWRENDQLSKTWDAG